jgi:hypothetical protein
MFRCLLWSIAAAVRPKVLLIADNLRLRQQLLLLQRRKSPPDCAGATDPHPAHDHREPTLGSAADSGGAGKARLQSFGENGCQVYASNPSSRTIFPLAVIPEAVRIDRVGVRLLLCPDHHV